MFMTCASNSLIAMFKVNDQVIISNLPTMVNFNYLQASVFVARYIYTWLTFYSASIKEVGVLAVCSKFCGMLMIGTSLCQLHVTPGD